MRQGEGRHSIHWGAGFYSHGEIRLGHGRNRARLFLKEHPDIGRQIEEAIHLHVTRNGGGVKMTGEPSATIEPGQDHLLPDEVAEDADHDGAEPLDGGRLAS